MASLPGAIGFPQLVHVTSDNEPCFSILFNSEFASSKKQDSFISSVLGLAIFVVWDDQMSWISRLRLILWLAVCSDRWLSSYRLHIILKNANGVQVCSSVERKLCSEYCDT